MLHILEAPLIVEEEAHEKKTHVEEALLPISKPKIGPKSKESSPSRINAGRNRQRIPGTAGATDSISCFRVPDLRFPETASDFQKVLVGDAKDGQLLKHQGSG